jgi:multidrug efflux pump subunit AcrA (membrane-fusion protein)
VQVLENGAPREVFVQAGIRAKGMVEIVSGLAEGDQVIIP